MMTIKYMLQQFALEKRKSFPLAIHQAFQDLLFLQVKLRIYFSTRYCQERHLFSQSLHLIKPQSVRKVIACCQLLFWQLQGIFYSVCIVSETLNTYWHKSIILIRRERGKLISLSQLKNALDYYDYSLKTKMSGYSLNPSNSSLEKLVSFYLCLGRTNLTYLYIFTVLGNWCFRGYSSHCQTSKEKTLHQVVTHFTSMSFFQFRIDQEKVSLFLFIQLQ